MANANYYIAGGKLYFKRKGETTFVEIGGSRKATLTTNIEFVDIMNHSGKTVVLAAKIPKEFKATLKFETSDWSPLALQMFLGATKGTATVTDSEAGWTAKNVTAYNIGKDTLITGEFKFISENNSGNEIVLEVFNASVKASGDMALQAEDEAALSFEGSVMLNDAGEYAKMYVADVA